MVNITVLRNVVLTSSKIILHFENSQLIFTWHKMASMCAEFHCRTLFSKENTRVGHFCTPPPKIEYATPDTRNKIGLKNKKYCLYLPRKQANTTKKHPSIPKKYVIFTRIPYFARVL